MTDESPIWDDNRRALRRYPMMRSLMASEPLAAASFAETLAAHARFLAGNGGGGSWTTLSVGEGDAMLVFGVYLGGGAKEDETGGAQAKLSHSNLTGLDLRGVRLAYGDLAGTLGRDQDCTGADLEGLLAIDADYSGTTFYQANLAHADFSRSDLIGCDFRLADLRGTDFEECDLTGADFRGANLEGARFPRARLAGAKHGT
jgi:hypothetical protein